MDQVSSIKKSEDWVEEAKRLYYDGLSYRKIGLELGKSKGQVAGKLNRADVLKTRTVVRMPPHRKKIVEVLPITFQFKGVKDTPRPPRTRLRLIESQMEVTLQELTKNTCRWPLGDPRRSDFRFCGCPPRKGSPYCTEHSIKAGRKYVEDHYDCGLTTV